MIDYSKYLNECDELNININSCKMTAALYSVVLENVSAECFLCNDTAFHHSFQPAPSGLIRIEYIFPQRHIELDRNKGQFCRQAIAVMSRIEHPLANSITATGAAHCINSKDTIGVIVSSLRCVNRDTTAFLTSVVLQVLQ
jgi:hypothetical protein